MRFPCGMMRDLIPLYIDGVCTDESQKAVQEHLSECEACKGYEQALRSEESLFDPLANPEEEKKMAESLKKVKRNITRKMISMIVLMTTGALLLMAGFYLLFYAAIREISPDDVSVSAVVYPMDELTVPAEGWENGLCITADEISDSPSYQLEIPALPDAEISISEKVMDENDYVTVITTCSDYHLKRVVWELKGDTLCISSFKTTILHNQVEDYQRTMMSLEFSEINRIVFLEKDGTEQLLWSRY